VAAGESPGSCMAGRQLRRNDFVPDIQTSVFPDWTRQELTQFSCLKKSSMSATGRACRDRKSLTMSAVFAFADPNLFTPFFISTGGHLLNVYKLARGIRLGCAFKSVSHKIREHVLAHFRSCLQAAYNLRVHDLTRSNVTSSGPVSLKGLTTVPSLTRVREGL